MRVPNGGRMVPSRAHAVPGSKLIEAPWHTRSRHPPQQHAGRPGGAAGAGRSCRVLPHGGAAGLQEGICNHFSAVVPGRPDLFLVNPYGWAFGEITASRLLICDFDGGVVAGEGVPEATAFFIHARLHLRNPRAAAAFHTHMPYATALAMLEGPPLVWAGQTALKFYGRTVVDEDYNGLALDGTEGDRIAAAMGDADIAFMRNHGVLVTGPSIAAAWDDLYYLERAAQAQWLAESSGRTLKPVPPAVAEATARQMRQARRRERPAASGKHQAGADERRAGVRDVRHRRLKPRIVSPSPVSGRGFISLPPGGAHLADGGVEHLGRERVRRHQPGRRVGAMLAHRRR